MREFLTRPDELRTLGVGEAYVWSTLGPGPERVQVTPAALPEPVDAGVSTVGLYEPAGPLRLPEAAPQPTGGASRARADSLAPEGGGRDSPAASSEEQLHDVF